VLCSAREVGIFSGSIEDLQQRLAAQHYVADYGLAVSIFLALRLRRPLFLEGEAGVGKTALAAAVASALDTDLIRLQCYEGLDITHAVYEWDYARQILELRIREAGGAIDQHQMRRDLYSETFLIKRPLLQAIDPARTRAAVLLIDEIDRADEEFEGYLLELLSEFQISIPEFGTVRASEPPCVILTSNRTREVHDALKRRCLYQWIEYPAFDKELATERAIASSTSPPRASRCWSASQASTVCTSDFDFGDLTGERREWQPRARLCEIPRDAAPCLHGATARGDRRSRSGRSCSTTAGL
jgi:MoxR-like ATPase